MAWASARFVFCVSCASVLALAALPARADVIALSDRQQAMYDTVAAPEGFITQDLHQAFWESLPRDMAEDAQIRAAFTGRLRETLSAGARFQREVWESARLSMAAGKVVPSPDLAAARGAAIKAARAAASQDPAFTETLAQMLALSDRLLEAAALGETVVVADGVIAMTPDTVTRTLSTLNAAMARLAVLFAPDWAPQPVARRHEDAGLTLRAALPFVKDVARRRDVNGDPRRTITLSHRSDEQAFVFVTYAEFAGPWQDPHRGMADLVRSALAQVGVAPGAVTPGTRPGRVGAQASGSGHRDETPVFAAAESMDVTERQAAVTVIAVTTESEAAAAALRGELLAALTVTP